MIRRNTIVSCAAALSMDEIAAHFQPLLDRRIGTDERGSDCIFPTNADRKPMESRP
jgi:hypothetical protein